MPDTLRWLQANYDALSATRARWAKRYDGLPDGSKEKQEVEKVLASLGERMRGIERRMSEIVESYGGDEW